MLVLPLYKERELLCRVANGEEAAFGFLFRAYHHRLGAYLLRLTESKPATEEIVQDVFLKIWLRRESLREVESFDAYLFTAARNHAFNHLRKMARERSHMAQLTYRPETQQEEDPLGEMLDAVVERLPPQQKNVYVLHRQQGLSHAEIAKRLHLSVQTVRKHMSLALRSIRGRLTG